MAIIKGSIILLVQLGTALLNLALDSGKIYGKYLLMQLSDWLCLLPLAQLWLWKIKPVLDWTKGLLATTVNLWALAPASSWWKRVTWCLAGAAHRMIFLLPSFIIQAFLLLTQVWRWIVYVSDMLPQRTRPELMTVLYRQSGNAVNSSKALVNNIAAPRLVTYQIQHAVLQRLHSSLHSLSDNTHRLGETDDKRDAARPIFGGRSQSQWTLGLSKQDPKAW